jgi:hypothetical protein
MKTYIRIFKTTYSWILLKRKNATVIKRTRVFATFILRMSALFPFGAVTKYQCVRQLLVYRYNKELIISQTELSHSRVLCSGGGQIWNSLRLSLLALLKLFRTDLGCYLQIVYNFLSSVYLSQYNYCSTLHKRSRWKKLWNSSRNNKKLSFPRVADKNCLQFSRLTS